MLGVPVGRSLPAIERVHERYNRMHDRRAGVHGDDAKGAWGILRDGDGVRQHGCVRGVRDGNGVSADQPVHERIDRMHVGRAGMYRHDRQGSGH